jgi:hypothetical protein
LTFDLESAAVPIPFRQELTAFFDEFAEHHRGVRRGKMFGLPAIYVGRRLVTCLIEDGIIVRLPEDVARREVREKRGTPYSHGRAKPGRWVLYRPRTAFAARELTAVVEAAARHVAERQTEEITGIQLRSDRRSRSRRS